MYIFGERSFKNLNTCHKDLITIAMQALRLIKEMLKYNKERDSND